MEIRVNGEPQTLDQSECTVFEFLRRNDVEPRGVAIAVNDAVVPKSAWEDTHIQDGDRIEIVRATQGG